MPNFLYEEPIKSLAARLVAQHLGGVAPKATLERIMRLVVCELRRDERNASPASADDISEVAPDWAKAAVLRGVQLHWFAPCPLAVARIKRTMKSLYVAYCDTRAQNETDLALMAAAHRLFQNLDHMTFGDLEAKAKAQSRMRARVARRRAEAAIKTLGFCEAETLDVVGGKRWRRLCSVAELGEVGKKMRNCTAFDRPQNRHYGQMLMDGDAEFWILETQDGEPLIELMASTTEKSVLECLGPGNRAVDPNAPELAALMRAKGFYFRRATRPSELRRYVLEQAAAVQREVNARLNRTG
ncbi:MAG: hypothetical protein JNJ73_17770 [Hyphomonadaceae bacterium]|nr:hypothetical protein [Hyphomonadaceae bacterium]